MNRLRVVLLLSFLILISFNISLAQNGLCASSLPFCTDTVYNFPAGVNQPSGEVGPDYTCLYSQPNPAWYYMEVLNSGPIIIYMSSTPAVDIDFSCWGPFTNQTTPCTAQLTSATTVDCSYSTSWNETADIVNAQAGEIYILLITNFSNSPCNINFSQTNVNTPGHGTTNCGILAPPIVNNGPLCEGQTLEISVTNPVPNAIYSWTGPNSFTSNQMNITIPNVTTAMGGDYSLVISLNGQTSPANVTTVVINPMPVVTLAPFQNVCSDLADFDLTGGSPVGGTYSGTGVSNGQFSPSTAGAGTFTITYNYHSPDSCGASTSADIVVEDRPVVIISNDTNLCQSGTATLTASGGGTYLWSNFAATPTIHVSPSVTTTYTVTVSSNIGCSDTASVVVNIYPDPVVSIKPISPDMCAGESIDLVGGGGDIYTWASVPVDPSLTGQNTQQLISVSPVSTTTYSVTATDTYGCINTSSQTVTIHPMPVANYYNQPLTASILEPTISFFNDSYGATSYYWTLEDGTTSTAPDFTHVFTDTGTYNVNLIVHNQWGCKDSTFGTVIIRPTFSIYIPNTFTPNKDLKNDIFYIYGEGIVDMNLRIFDRWGKVIFHTDDINMGWDGKVNGVNVPEGVYVYNLIYRDATNKKNYLRGTVTVLR